MFIYINWLIFNIPPRNLNKNVPFNSISLPLKNSLLYSAFYLNPVTLSNNQISSNFQLKN